MRRILLVAGALAVATAAALALTLRTTLGVPLWHANVAFLVTFVAAMAAWPLLSRRRIATLTMLVAAILATATGFTLLYTKRFAYKEWITWWHSVTSFAFLLTFLVHWLHNRTRLAHFTMALLRKAPLAAIGAGAAWTALAVFALWTLAPQGSARFTSANYQYLASLAVLAGVVLAYGAWLLHRLPAMRARLADTRHRNLTRGLIDTNLFLSHWSALLTGFALLYFAEPLRAGPLKYVSKWWHTATSVAFLALVVLHVGMNARLVKAHARRLDAELGGPREP